jgi:hypothetical protein
VKGLEKGSDWNKDLLNILALVVKQWLVLQMAEMNKTRVTLMINFDGTYNHVLYLINKSLAGFGTIEKAKQKWALFRVNFLALNGSCNPLGQSWS